MLNLLDPIKILGYDAKPTQQLLTDKDAIIYALGIAFSIDPLKSEDWQYTFEQNDGFKVFPTIATILPKTSIMEDLQISSGVSFNPMMLLHGEQRIELYYPLRIDTNYLSLGKITDVQDKKKGALLTYTTDTYEVDQQGKEILTCKNISSLYIRGQGGFGFKGIRTTEKIPKIPNKMPTKQFEQQTFPNQAIFYRLSGDTNPLHIDPDMAALGGFKQPILHGLATYGMCAKVIIQTFCKGDGDKLKAYQARFTSHVFPGETLLVQMWKDGSRIIFSAKTKERELEVIRGFMDIIEDPKL